MDCFVVPEDVLLAFKWAHIYWPLQWAKHIHDLSEIGNVFGRKEVQDQKVLCSVPLL